MARDIKPDVDVPASQPLAGIYREQYPFVWSVLRRVGIPDADLEDATQDVFVVVHHRLARFDGRAALRTWLYAIAVRVAANRRRKYSRRQSLAAMIPARVDEDPEEQVARVHARTVLDDLLARLDDDKRVVFVLAELEELTVPAIADIVGANVRTVYSRLRAARARVATELARLHDAPEIDAAITAARVRTPPPSASERRVWAGVLAHIAAQTAAAPMVMSAGLATFAKATIAGIGVVATAIVVAIAVPEPASTAVDGGATAPAPSRPIADHETAVASTRSSAPLVAASIAPTSAPKPSPRAEPRRPAATPSPAEPADRLAEELALVDDARAALADGRIDATLAALDEHARRFPRGELRPEADATRMRVLCGLESERGETLARARGLALACPDRE